LKPQQNIFAKYSASFFFPLVSNWGATKQFADDSLLLGRLLLALVLFVQCAGFICGMVPSLLDFILSNRYHDTAYVRRCCLAALSRGTLLLPLHILQSLTQMEEIIIWLQEAAKEDPDDECRQISAGVYFSLKEILDMSVINK